MLLNRGQPFPIPRSWLRLQLTSPPVLAQALPYPARPIGYHVNRTGRRLQHRLMELVAAQGYDYPVEFWPALHHLYRAGGALSQNRLADYLFRDKATVARLVARMERDGFVRREPDPADRRLKRVLLTPFGKTVTAQLRSHVHAMVSRSTRDIPAADLETCLDVLDQVFENLSPPP